MACRPFFTRTAPNTPPETGAWCPLMKKLDFPDMPLKSTFNILPKNRKRLQPKFRPRCNRIPILRNQQ